METKQRLMDIFETLYAAYGPQHWWPGESPFEVLVGAVLTQNTAWQNVARAIDNLKDEGLLEPEALLSAKPERVKELIATAGFYNVKSDRLMNLLRYLANSDLSLESFRSLPLAEVREELLEVNGVGPETADSILLYAFQRPVFVVDAYTRRLFSRLGYGWMETAPYARVQAFFMETLLGDTALFNEYHALIVKHNKDVCKKQPRCDGCCLRLLCAAPA